MTFEWIRATASVVRACSFCQEGTNRITGFKKPEDNGYTTAFVCNDCHDGMKTAPERRPGDA